MKIVLLGADGQLAKAFIKHFAWQNFNTVTLSHKHLDVTNKDALIKALNYHRPDIVLNCAAYTDVDKAEIHSDLCSRVNTEAPETIAKWCTIHDALVVHFSTDYVFDGQKNSPYSEADIVSPLNVYGLTKLLGELAIKHHATKYLIFRTSWLFSSAKNCFVAKMVRRALSKQYTKVVNDQFGCPNMADDIAHAVLAVIQQYAAQKSLPYGIYHLSGTSYCSWYGFASKIFTLAEPSSSRFLTAISSPFPSSVAARPAYSCLDSSLFQRTFSITLADWQLALAAVVEEIMSTEQT